MTENKHFLHLFGTHSSGKTTVNKAIGDHLGVQWESGGVVHSDPNNQCMVLGKYSVRGKYMGLDGATMTQVERFDLIEKYWDSPHRLLLVDGCMMITWSSFWERYQHLPQVRNIWGIWLMITDEMAEKRTVARSGRKWTEKKLKSIRSKRKSCVYVFNKAREIPSYRIERMKHHKEDHFKHLTRKITRVTGIDLTGCSLKNPV